MRYKSGLKTEVLLTFFVLAALVSACATQPAPPTATIAAPTASVAPAPETTSPPADDSGETSADDVSATVAARTPEPTTTPGLIDQEIDDLTTSLGLTGKTFLGLTVDDWISLIFSTLIVVAGYFLGFKLLVWFLKWIARRTSRKFNETVLKEIEPELKLLLLVIFTRFAVLRLDFLSVEVKNAAEIIHLSKEAAKNDRGIIIHNGIFVSPPTLKAAHKLFERNESINNYLSFIEGNT